MSSRFDNRRIFYILAVLLVILVLTVILKIPREKATLTDKLIDLDTASVSKILFYPRVSQGEPFEFVKSGGKWSVQQKNVVSEPEKDAVRSIFTEVQNLKPKSLEAVDKSKWKEFNLSDSLAIRIRFLDAKGKTLADLMIGKFSYRQVNNPYGGSGPNNIQGTSYVRLYDQKKVYGVDGFLSLSLSGKFDDYRDKSLIKLKKDDVTKISFTFPADSSYILSKKDSFWYAGNKIADSSNVADFLNALSYLNGQDFMNGYKPPVNPAYQMAVEGNNLLSISVKCYIGENKDEYILNSTLNPDVYFSSRKDGIFSRLFKPEGHFLPKSKGRKS
jgi:Domain of unknown function (DUF4340)